MSDGNLEFEVKTEASSITEGVSQLTSQLEQALTKAATLRDNFVSTAMAAEVTAEQAAALKKVLDSLKAQSAGDAFAKNSFLGSQSPVNSGTLRDDQLRNFQFSALKTSINTSADQIAARLAEEGAKAAERLLKTTAKAIETRLAKTVIGVEDTNERYGSSKAILTEITKRRIARETDDRKYSGVTNLEEFEAKKAAEKAESDLKKYLEGVKRRSIALEPKNMEAFRKSIEDEAKKAAEETLDAVARQYKLFLTSGTPVAQAKQVRQLVNDEKLVRKYYGVTTPAEFAAKEAAEAEERDLKKYLEGVKKRSIALSGKYMEEYRKSEEKEFNDQLAESARRLKIMEASKRLEDKTNIASSQESKRQAQKAYRDSPAGVAEGFENRIRIFADYATIGGAILTIRQLLGAVTELDDGLLKFQAITQTSNGEMGKFKEQLLEIGSASRYSLKDLTEVATTLGQTGLAAGDVAKALPSVINLATASGSSLKEATDILTTAIGAYNMQAEKAPDVANTITSALNKTKLTVTQLGQGLSYAANVANESGVSFNELTAVLAGLSQAGIKSGSTAGTGTRQLIQELISPSDKLLKMLKTLGISMTDIDVKANGLIGVLENLSKHGFGTSEALKSLDLRAASTFSALTSRLDRVKALQESLALSNSAAEGAAKASESLTAVWTALGNKAVSLTDKSLAPMVEALKALGVGLGVVADAANKAGPVLPILGTLVTAGAGAAGVTWILKLASGIGTLTTSLIGAEAAATGLGAALLALGKTPVGIAFGLGVAGIAAAGLLGGPSPLEKRIDDARGVLNDLTSRQQQTETSLANLDHTITGLIEKKEKLDKDSFARRDVLLQAQKDFAGLGLNVDLSTTSVQQLIDALRKLHGELANTLPGNFALQRENLIKKLGLDTQASDLQDAKSAQRILEGAGLGSYTLRKTNQDFLRDSVRQRFGGDFDQLLSFLFTDSSKLDTSDVRSISGRFGGLLSSRLDAARNRKASGENVDGELKLLEALLLEMNDKVGRLSGLQSTNVDIRQTQKNQSVSEIQALDAFKGLETRRDNLFGLATRGIHAIQGNVNTTPAQKLKEIDDLRAEILGQLNQDAEEVAKLSQSLQREGKSPEEVKAAFSQMKNDLEKIRSFALDTEGDLKKAATPLADYEYQKAKKANETSIQLKKKVLGSATTIEDIDQANKELKELYKKTHDLEIDAAKRKFEDVTKQREALESIDATTSEQLKIADETADNLRKKIIDRLFSADEAATKAQHDALQKQIAEMEKELNRPSTTADRAKKLRDTIDGLLEQAISLVEKQSTIELTKSRLSSSSLPTGPVAAQIAELATQQGKAGLIRYLLGLGNAESGLNPQARNGTATGLFQFKPDTFTANGGGDLFSVADQVRAVLKLIAGDFEAFHSKFGRAPEDNELYLLHQQGRAGGLALLDPANAGRSAADVLSPFYKSRAAAESAITRNGGTLDQTAAQFAQTVERYFDKKAGTDVTGDRALRAKKAADDEAARTAARTAREANDVAIERKEFNERLLRDRAAKSADEASIQRSRSLLKTTFDDGEVERLLIGIVGSLKGMLEREIADYRANPANKDKLPAEQAADIEEIRRRYGARAETEVIQNADLISKRITERQAEIVHNLELQQAEQERNPARFTGKQIRDTRQQLYEAKEKLDIETALEAKKRELALLDRQIAAIQQTGLASEEKITGLKERQKSLEKEINVARKRRSIHQDAEDRPDSIADGLSSGTERFFQSAGLYNAKGKFKSFAEEISEIWAQSMGSMNSGLSKLFSDLASGTVKGKDAFRAFAQSVIQSMLQIVSTALANQILRGLFGGELLGGGGGGGGGLLGALLPKATGGFIGYAAGGAAANRDSVPALLMPGEYVLRKTAVDAIGRGRLDQLNNMGPSKISTGEGALVGPQKPAKPAVTNVWVVSPDQVPPPSSSDIVVTVARDIQNKGSLRTLIRSVAAGTI